MSFEGTVMAQSFYAAICLFPTSEQQKSLMFGMAQLIAVGQDGWGRIFKMIDSIISQEQLNRIVGAGGRGCVCDFQVRKAAFQHSRAAVLR